MLRSSQSGVLVLCLTIGFVFSVQFLLPYIAPFLFALLFTALIDAPCTRLENAGVARGVAVMLVLGALVSGLALTLFLVVVNLAGDLLRLAEQLPNIGRHLQELTSLTIQWAAQVNAGLPAPLADALRSSTDRLSQGLEILIRNILAALAGLPSFLASLAVAVLATFFLARDGRSISHHLVSNLPRNLHLRTARINREIFAGVVGFVRAQVLLMVISSILTTIALLLFSVPYAWLLGILAGVCDLLPILGVSGVFIPLIVGEWVSGYHSLATGLAAAWGVVLLVRQVCEPALISARIGLHPLTSLAAMYIGLQAWGLMGAFLGPVIATSGKILWLGAVRPMLFGR